MSEWIEKPLGALARLEIGGTPSRNVAAYWADSNDGGHPWVSIADLRAGRTLETSEFITDLGVKRSNVKLVKAGTVLMTFKLTIGEVAYAKCDLFTNEAIVAINPFEGQILPEFLFYTLPHGAKSAVAENAIKGSTLNKEKLRKIRISFPSDEKSQQSIVAVLSALDSQIEATEALISKQERVRAGLLQELFTRGVDEHGTLRPGRDEAPHLYRETELGWLPQRWRVLQLSCCSDSVIDGPFGSNLKSEHYVDEPGVRVVRLQNIQSGHYDESDEAFVSDKHAKYLSKHSVLPGDVLIASLGDDKFEAGRACCYPNSIGLAINKADCFRLRPKLDIAEPQFMMLLLNSDRAKRENNKLIQGVTRQRINLGNLKRLKVAIPDVCEQGIIINNFEIASRPLEGLSRDLSKYRMLRSGVMQDLLTGRVPVDALLESEPV